LPEFNFYNSLERLIEETCLILAYKNFYGKIFRRANSAKLISKADLESGFCDKISKK
jgi:hypothetical protein